MKYINYYKQIFGLFLKKIPTNNLIINYYLGDDTMLQDFVHKNLKDEFNWSTGIGIIEAVQKIVQEAIYNGNFKNETTSN